MVKPIEYQIWLAHLCSFIFNKNLILNLSFILFILSILSHVLPHVYVIGIISDRVPTLTLLVDILEVINFFGVDLFYFLILLLASIIDPLIRTWKYYVKRQLEQIIDHSRDYHRQMRRSLINSRVGINLY